MIPPGQSEDRRLSPAQRLDWLRLYRSENVGPRTFRELVNRYGGARAALAALPELSRRGGRRGGIGVCSQDDAERETDALARLGARLITLADREYPPLLRRIADPPPVIAAMGRLDLLARPAVAIVGARGASALGLKMAALLARDLGRSGRAVVSGLARGIDAAAHKASLETGTIAVAAGGIDVIYPPQNAPLAAEIGSRGVILSEIALGTAPTRTHFPRRNRLVSGIAQATIVIDAAARSGSLITARFALEQNREVLAVPGSPLDPRAAGCNALIREGATLVRTAEDVIEALEPIAPGTRPDDDDGPGLFETEPVSPSPPPQSVREAVTSLLSVAPVEVDELARAAQAPVGDVMGVLLELELAGRLTRHPGQRVALRP